MEVNQVHRNRVTRYNILKCVSDKSSCSLSSFSVIRVATFCLHVCSYPSCRSDTNSLQSHSNTVRLFTVNGQMKNEACLVEVTPEDNLQPLSSCLRSRGCYIVYDASAGRAFVWYGCRSTKILKRCATQSARMLRTR